MSSPEPPLHGTRVLSVGHALPGLYCCAILRDLGAEVVRIERVARDARRPKADAQPQGREAAAQRGEAERSVGPREGREGEQRRAPAKSGGEVGPYAAFLGRFPMRSVNAGTSECRLDLRDPRGRDAFLRLAARSDAVLEGFRPGVTARLGIDYARLSAQRPALVYAAISGYGQEGPLAQRVGHDLNYLAETGVLGLANPVGLPGTTFADGLAGISGALNVVAALGLAARTGQGQFLDLAIVDAPLFLLASEFEHYWRSGESRGPGDTHLTGRYPWYAVHSDADGGSVAVGAVEPHFHAALVHRLGHPELAARQFGEGAAREQAHAALTAAFAASKRSEIEQELGGSDTCVSPVASIAEVAASPLAERVVCTGAGGERLVRTPVRLRAAAPGPERATAGVLADSGFSAAEIRDLQEAGVAGGD